MGVLATTPMAQIHKVFLLFFVHKKKCFFEKARYFTGVAVSSDPADTGRRLHNHIVGSEMIETARKAKEKSGSCGAVWPETTSEAASTAAEIEMPNVTESC